MSETANSKRFALRRSAILTAAIEEINRRGVRGMTMALVAGHLELAPPAVVYYFKTKEELAVSAFRNAIDRYNEILASACATPRSAVGVRAWVAGFIELHRQIAIGAAQPIANFNDVRALNNAQVNEAYVAMFRNVRQLVPFAPESTSDGRNARAHLLLSQLLWSTAWLKWFDPRDYPRLADRLADVLLNGFIQDHSAIPAPRRELLSIDLNIDGLTQSEMFLRAATQLINEKGYHGASVERISSRLNVSKGAFYHHNATKNDLVLECFQRTFDLIWSAIDDADRCGGSALKVIVSICTSLVAHQFSGGAPLLSTTALSTVPEGIRTQLMETLDRIGRRFASILSDGFADESIRAVDINVAAQVLTGAVNAAADLKFWAREVGSEAFVLAYVGLVFGGLELRAKP